MKVLFLSLLVSLTAFCACQPSAGETAASASNTDVGSTTTEAATTDTLPQIIEDIDVPAFREKMREAGVVILDVRTPEETAQGMIEGAVGINFFDDNFEAEIDKLEIDKTYLVYCRSGARSGKAAHLMASKGFKKVYNLLGGYNAWSQQN